MSATFLTANDLRTGEIVFWTSRGVWSAQADQALIADTEAEQAQLTHVLNDPKIEVEVVGPYLVTAGSVNQGSISPTFPKKLRDRQRLAGPGPDLLPG